jgi:hypothetical protein
MRRRRAAWAGLVTTLLACGPSQLRPHEPAAAQVAQTALDFPDTYVSGTATQPLDVTNVGGQRGIFTTSVDAPFSLDVDSTTLGAGEGAQLQVHFTPVSEGSFTAVAHVGDVQVPVHGRALAIPQCEAATLCNSNTFDPNRAQCVAESRPDGTSCQNACILDGACLSGACVGQPRDCDDANACTTDACGDETGCVHEARHCDPPVDPCQRATCDVATGCGLEPLDDGALCAADDCLRDEVHVCISGECLTRPRAGGTTNCHDQWVPLTMSQRSGPSMAWDGAHQQTVLFGGMGTLEGTLAETWAWDGEGWTQLHPLTSPPARSWASLAWDSDRKRVVLFGGAGTTGTLADTWEWDGRDWLQRRVQGPPARWAAAMAYDSARKRTVLFGGGGLDDTWEWDGVNWSHRTPPASPPGRNYAGLTYDPLRRRTVLFGGVDMNGWLDDTWEWDGATWLRATPSTSPERATPTPMTWDPVTERCLLVDHGLWEWDGTTWTQTTYTGQASQVTWDTKRGRAVLYDGEGTSRPTTIEWDGLGWIRAWQVTTPLMGGRHWLSWDDSRQWGVMLDSSAAISSWDGTWHESAAGGVSVAGTLDAVTFDSARAQFVAVVADPFGLGPELTWTLDDQGWSPVTGAGPPSRTSTGLAWDAARQKVVLFGGSNRQGNLNDTWEWDGVSWTQRFPTNSPSPRWSASLTWDAARSRVVLFGGGGTQGYLGDTWEWDGTNWTAMTNFSSLEPARRAGASLAYDPSRRRVVLFGGIGYGTGLVVNDTLEWDGRVWTKRPLTRSPPARSFGAMAYDQVRGRMTLFGGGDDSTWLLLP